MFFKFSSAFVLAAASFVNAAAVASLDCGYHHIANVGDSCESIAYHTGAHVQDLHDCNAWLSSTCDNIVAGSDIHYPSSGLSQPNWTCGGSSYTVQQGDSCESIAADLGVEVASIYFCNSINAGCANIYAGRALSIKFK